ncbi:MAG: hypothetical protein ACYCVB_02260 [Bacilli bacterium]
MDMTNSPSPFILHAFYTTMLWQLPIVLALCAIAVVIQRICAAPARGPEPGLPLLREGAATDLAGRKALRVALAVLWILDGLLQAQPDMSSEFIPNIVNPSVSAQPPLIAHLLQPLTVIWSQHPIGFDLLAIWVQLSIGLLILFGGDSALGSAALWCSILWGSVVWVTGEGFGGVFSGSATWLAGDPGAVLFYMIGAFFLLAQRSRWEEGDIFRVFRTIMSLLWAWAAVAQSWPPSGFWTGPGLSAATLGMAEMPQPRPLAEILYGFATWLDGAPVVWNTVFILIMAALCVGWTTSARQQWVWRLTYAWLGFTWVFGQEFGVLGGLGTDPNASLVLGVLVYAVGASGVHRAVWRKPAHFSPYQNE